MPQAFTEGQRIVNSISVVLIVVYIIILLLPRLSTFFDLVPLHPLLHFSVAVLRVLWVLDGGLSGALAGLNDFWIWKRVLR